MLISSPYRKVSIIQMRISQSVGVRVGEREELLAMEININKHCGTI